MSADFQCNSNVFQCCFNVMQVIFVLPKSFSMDVSSKQTSKLWSSVMHIFNFLEHNEWSNGSWIQMQSIKLPWWKRMATLFSYCYVILKSLHLPWVNLPPLSCSHFLFIMAVLYISSLSFYMSSSFSSLSRIVEAGGRIRQCTPPAAGLHISFSLFLFQPSVNLFFFFFFFSFLFFSP